MPIWEKGRPRCPFFGYPRKAEQVGRDSGARRAPLSRLKLVPLFPTG